MTFLEKVIFHTPKSFLMIFHTRGHPEDSLLIWQAISDSVTPTKDADPDNLVSQSDCIGISMIQQYARNNNLFDMNKSILCKKIRPNFKNEITLYNVNNKTLDIIKICNNQYIYNKLATKKKLIISMIKK